MKPAANYKTQSGLIKALEKASSQQMTVSLSWWYSGAKYTLINKWGWKDLDAEIFIMRYKSGVSAYTATA